MNITRIKNGESRQNIVDEKGIGMRTIERWITNESQMRKEAESSPASRKRKRTGKHGDVDEAAMEWFEACRNQKQIITGPMLMKKSLKFAEQLGSDFRPNTGWLGRLKKRNNIKFKRAHGEKNSADLTSAEKWLEERLPDIMATYSEEQIYNADETGLFYRATPNATLCFV